MICLFIVDVFLFWFGCLILLRPCRREGYILVPIVVRLGVRGEPQVLKVLIKVNVFPQKYMGFLEMKYVLMIEGDLSDWMLMLSEIPGMS